MVFLILSGNCAMFLKLLKSNFAIDLLCRKIYEFVCRTCWGGRVIVVVIGYSELDCNWVA